MLPLRPFLIFTIVVISFTACKKTDHPVKNLAIDPIANETFGTRLEVNGNDQLQYVTWSADSRSLFLKTEDGSFIMDATTKIITQLLPKEVNGFIVQSSPDSRLAVFNGLVNGVNGFYTIDISSKQIKEILQFGSKQAAMVYYGASDMFYYKGDVTSVGRPCESWDDVFCGVRNTTTNVKFVHKRFDSNVETRLPPDLSFVSYSPDGSKVLLTRQSLAFNYDCYMYDVVTEQLEDSVQVVSYSPLMFHWNGNTPLYAYRAVNQSSQYVKSSIFVVDLFAGQIVAMADSELFYADDNSSWPQKSDWIFYSGACSSGCTFSISRMHPNTRTERQLVSTSYDELQGGSPFTLTPSPDGSQLVFSDGYAWYLKKID